MSVTKQSISDALKRNGFCFTDVDTPNGTVRITARGPKSPADPPNDGERDTVVKVQRGGTVLAKEGFRNRSLAARRYVELVDEYGGEEATAGDGPPAPVKTASWSSMTGGKPLRDQLEEEGIEYEEADVPRLVGMGGSASLIFYHSPDRDTAITVLAVPVRTDVDRWAEKYAYFEMDKETALKDERLWIDVYNEYLT